jgi:hypothetical protein
MAGTGLPAQLPEKGKMRLQDTGWGQWNMDGYKKILKNKNLRYRILSLARVIPDKPMLQLQYWIKLKRKLDLKDPRRFTEKIQWYKLYYKNPVMPVCADKFAVREYIRDKGLGHILTDLYAVYEREFRFKPVIDLQQFTRWYLEFYL